MRPRVYVDLDGVLADFEAGAFDFFHILASKDYVGFNKMLASPMGWPRLMKHWPTFWMDLPLMPHAMDLWKRVKPYHPAILTAIPPSWPSAATGKNVWVRRHLPKFGMHPHETFHAVKRAEKQQYARQPNGTPNLLIDDHETNIREWTAAGGMGVLYVDGPSGLRRVEIALNTLSN